MTSRYHCSSEQRRAAVRNKAGWNGIDYLEVEPTTSTSQPVPLRVVFLKPDGLNALGKANFRVEGGVRYRNPPVQDAKQDPPGSNTVVVTMKPVETDFSNYRLRFVGATGDTPPANFDPELAEVAFSFKVNCPTPFDCRPPASPPAPPPRDPELDYDARDWQSFRRLMLDRLAALLPDFRDDTPVDFLHMQVEALAAVADHLSYKLDAVATEQTLWTARSRISLARHARLLDYPVHEGSNARAFVQVRYQPTGAAPATVTLKSRTPLTTRTAADPATIAPDEFAKRLPFEPLVFETMHDLELREGNNAIAFHTWSDSRCALPRGAKRVTVRKAETPASPAALLRVGDFLALQELATPGKRHVVRLTEVKERRDEIEGLDVIDVRWAEEDALPFDLVLDTLEEPPGAPAKRIVRAQAAANIALADHGLTLPMAGVPAATAAEQRPTLDPAHAPAQGAWRPRLSRSDLVRAAPADLTREALLSAQALLANPPERARPALVLDDGFHAWDARPSLLASERFDRHVVVETEHDGRVQLRFGDNVMGLKPLSGTRVSLSGRFARHLDGRIGADVLRRVVTTVPGITAATNPLSAVGGSAALSPTVVRIEAPYAFRTQERAVTEADYAEMAERHPGVQKAVARIRWTAAWRTAFIYLDRKGGAPVESDRVFVSQFLRHMERYRLAGMDVALRGAVPVSLEIVLRVCVQPAALRAEVLRRLNEALGAFFDPDNFTFGTPLYLSALIAAVMAVPGVASVEPVTFQRWAKAAKNEIVRGLIEAGDIEVLRLSNDPSFPEQGRFSFQMLGGL